MEKNTTVLVIGGGATGVGITRDLAMRDVDVTLVDREGLSSGTSGRSHGLLHSGARYAESDQRGAEECIKENKIIKYIGGVCVEDTGGLFVELEDDDEKYFDTKVSHCKEVGIPIEVITGEKAREMEPSLSENVTRAFTVPDAAIYPSRLIASNAESASRNGATIMTDSPVEEIDVSNGNIKSVSLGDENNTTIYPEFVVNSTGAWAEQCASLAGVDVKMKPTKGVMVGVDFPQLNTVVNRCRVPDNGDIAIPHKRQVILGTTSIVVDDPDEYPKEEWETELMIEECSDMILELKDKQIERTYWGVRPLYAPDETKRETTKENTGEGRGISRGFTLLNHSQDGIENFVSVVGGKLTTYRLMAEETTDVICQKLNVEKQCETHNKKLPHSSNEQKLDELVQKYNATSPADKDVVN